MNKQEYLELIDGLNLPKNEYYILGSGSLLLHGIRDIANDVDLCVSPELFNVLKARYNIDLSKKNNCGFYQLNDKLEVVVSDKTDFNFDIVLGYPVESLQQILKFKQERNKPKDQNDIVKIKAYLKQYDK